MRISASALYWVGRAGVILSVLLMGTSALLLLSGADLLAVIILGFLAVVMAVVSLTLAYAWERRTMLEQGVQDLGEELGFRVIVVHLGESEGDERDQYSVVFLEADGQPRAVQPAQQYAFRMWEKLRGQKNQIIALQAELAAAKGQAKKTEIHEDGTVEIKTQGGRV